MIRETFKGTDEASPSNRMAKTSNNFNLMFRRKNDFIYQKTHLEYLKLEKLRANHIRGPGRGGYILVNNDLKSRQRTSLPNGVYLNYHGAIHTKGGW